MHKKLFLFLLTLQCTFLFSNSPDTIKIRFPETMKSIDAQIHSNNLGLWHTVPLSGLGISSLTLILAGNRLQNNDIQGGGIMASLSFVCLLFSAIMYAEDKNMEQKQLEQNERLIEKKAQLEKSLQQNE